MNLTFGDIMFGIWVLAAVATMFGLSYETDGFCRAVEQLKELRKTDAEHEKEER